ncbi:membrane protein [Microbacterium phage Morrigan]|nr:membrane protein [Microbacterium phage Morrigan]
MWYENLFGAFWTLIGALSLLALALLALAAVVICAAVLWGTVRKLISKK